MHTYGTFIVVPSAAKEWIELADTFIDAVNAKHRNSFYRRMSTTPGVFKDSQFLTYSRRPSFTLELRGNGFDVHRSLIRLSGEEMYEGFKQFATALRNV